MPIAPVIVTAAKGDLDKEIWEMRGQPLPHDPEWTLTEIADVTPLTNTFGGNDDLRTQALVLFDATKKAPEKTPAKKTPRK